MARKLPHLLDDADPERLLRATRTERDRVLLMALLYLGLRAAELCALEVGNLDFGRGLVFVREAKRGKQRALPIPRKFLPILRGWVGPRASGPVFPSREGGGRMTTRAVQYLVKRAAIAAGLRDAAAPRKYHPHAMRHQFATRMLRRGADIHAVKEALGHSSIQTTAVYLSTTPEHLRGAMEI